MKAGYVYILSNRSMPGVVKIGRSINGGKCRAGQIFQTGVPEPFKLEFEVYCADCVWLEQEAHKALDSFRVSDNREFFRVPVNRAIAAVLAPYVSEFEVGELVDTESRDAIVDLMAASQQTGIPLEDLMQSVLFVSEFAWRSAITERDEVYARASVLREAD